MHMSIIIIINGFVRLHEMDSIQEEMAFSNKRPCNKAEEPRIYCGACLRNIQIKCESIHYIAERLILMRKLTIRHIYLAKHILIYNSYIVKKIILTWTFLLIRFGLSIRTIASKPIFSPFTAWALEKALFVDVFEIRF